MKLYMNKYEQAAQKAWDAIISKVREMEQSGVKRAEISRLLGHKGRSTVTNWLDEHSDFKAKGSFPDVLRYLDVLGLDINDFLPPMTIRRLPTVEHFYPVLVPLTTSYFYIMFIILNLRELVLIPQIEALKQLTTDFS